MMRRSRLVPFALLLSYLFLGCGGDEKPTRGTDGAREWKSPKPRDHMYFEYHKGKMTLVAFPRLYFIQSKGKDLQVAGIPIYERIFIIENTGTLASGKKFDIEVEAKKTTTAPERKVGKKTVAAGHFGDDPMYGEEKSTKPIAAGFHIKVKRVIYIKSGGKKVILGGNTFEFKKKPGDNEVTVRKNSSMTEWDPKATFDSPPGTKEIKDSGD